VKLSLLHEDEEEFTKALASSTQNQTFQAKKNQRTPKARNGSLPKDPHMVVSGVPRKPRHRKFLGVQPHAPY